MANQEEHDIEDVAALDAEVTEAEKHDDKDEEDDKEDKKSKKSKKKDHDDKDDMKEETMAASSLKPKGAPGEPMSKIHAMTGVMNMMSGMKSNEILDFFNKTMAQFGPNKMPGAVDNSSKNTSTLDMKASHASATTGPKTKDGMPKLDSKNHWAEDVEQLFSGEELSEELKEKTSTLFEAAVNLTIVTEVARLEEEYEAKLEESLNTFQEELTSKLDTYLDYVVEQFMKENEVAIESTLRNEIAEEFIDGLKNLFAEHYISVPEDKVDVLEAMAQKVATLEEKYDEAIEIIAEKDSIISEAARSEIFAELSADLALTQQEKFAALAEGIEFDGDLDVYGKKLSIIKENYFKNETAVTTTSNIEEETFEGEISESTRNVDPVINRYVQAIAKTVKK
jgi:hypothetical protein